MSIQKKNKSYLRRFITTATKRNMINSALVITMATINIISPFDNTDGESGFVVGVISVVVRSGSQYPKYTRNIKDKQSLQ